MTPTSQKIDVVLPNHACISSTHTAKLTLPQLPAPATAVHLFPSLATGSLLSIGQFCDHGCTATFTKTKATVSHNGETILEGTRHPSTSLWHVDPNMSSIHQPSPSMNATVGQPSAANRIRFYHAALFSPTLTTLQSAIKAGFLSSFPGLDLKTLQRHPPLSEATIKGHLIAKRQHLRSTKKVYTSPHHLYNVTKDNPTRTNQVFADCFQATGRIYTDQTGPFLTPSTSGNRYVFVLYDHDSNYIAAVAIPSRTKDQLIKAYRSIIQVFIKRGLQPKLQRLDNEVSSLMRDEMDSFHITYQLTPAGNHGRNAAERAIQTFKSHFIAGLCSTHPTFPLRHWDKLLPQAVLTLNLLRPARLHPQLSAFSNP